MKLHPGRPGAVALAVSIAVLGIAAAFPARAVAATNAGQMIANTALAQPATWNRNSDGSYRYTGDWCADFAAWVWEDTGVPNSGATTSTPGNIVIASGELTGWARSFDTYGTTRGTTSYWPHVGDVVVFDNGSNPSNGDPAYTIEHVGIVVSVSGSGSSATIQTVEGNTKGTGTGDSYWMTSSVNRFSYLAAPRSASYAGLQIREYVSPAQFNAYGTQPKAALMAADFTGDGQTDIIARQPSGSLWVYPHTAQYGFGTASQIGIGISWQNMTVLMAADFNGDGKADIIAEDSSGNLWLYPHTTQFGFGAPSQLASGWQKMTALMAADFNGDVQTDIIARDSSGNLWLYPQTASAGLGARVQIGNGWQNMTALMAADFTGDGQTDIIARESGGNLLLYPHTWWGGYGTPGQIGNGWQNMTALMAADFNGDGNTDIIARDSSGNLLLYPHTSPNGVSRFAASVLISGGW